MTRMKTLMAIATLAAAAYGAHKKRRARKTVDRRERAGE